MFLRIFFLALLLASCNKEDSWLMQSIDAYTFNKIGGVIFEEVEQVSLKEIHLDSGLLINRTIIVEGKIVKIGEYGTYIIMSDDSYRILVMNAKIDIANNFKENKHIKNNVRVLGKIKTNRQGQPFVSALAINFFKDKEAI